MNKKLGAGTLPRKILIVFLATIGLKCSSLNPQIAGNGSEVETAIVQGVIVDTNGVPEPHVQVRIIPVTYNPAKDTSQSSLPVDTTDGNGTYQFPTVSSNTYNIQAINFIKGTRLLIRNVRIAAKTDSITVPDDTLRAPGSLSIPLPVNGSFIYLQGTTLYSPPPHESDLPGFALLDFLPSGPIPAIYAWTAGTTGAGMLLVQDSAEIVPNDTSVAGTVPAPWKNTGIGSEQPAGGAAFVNDTFTIAGGGPDIYGPEDGCQFVYQEWQGDVSIIARVNRVEFTDTNAKACLMIRESLSGFAPNAAMEMQPVGWATFQWRDSLADTTGYIEKPPTVPFPQWIRLERRGDTLSGYYSTDGSNWTKEGSRVVPLPSDIYVGLAVTSHRLDKLCTAVFDSVKLSP